MRSFFLAGIWPMLAKIQCAIGTEPMPATTSSNNILFIMCDQLRFDYLSCYGHRHLHTPNIDKLAQQGVRFTNAYCASPICGASRASYYTGRYVASHGVMGNDDFLKVDEKTIADYLQPLGYRSAVVGKTHSRKNLKAMQTLGIDKTSPWARASQTGGFEAYESHEGLFPNPVLKVTHPQGYDSYLKSMGYGGDNPWEQCANSGVDAAGNLHSGWALRSSQYPAAVAEEHSETAFTTQRAMDFMAECGDQPFCLHLSYIKPHWPVIAPAPYHNMYGVEDMLAWVGNEAERDNPHVVYQAFMEQEYSQAYAQQKVRETVIPAYMGLVKQIDDHLGKLFAFMEERDLDKNTLIVFTADHGDYLGDHYLGEKDLFHDCSAKVPLIIVDPRQQADTNRACTNDQLIEAVDILPSMLDYAGGKPCIERLEGQSLMPLLQGDEQSLQRDYAISEIDYADRGVRSILGLDPYQCRATMVRNQRWKFIYHHQFSAQLFDLDNDPQELVDLGDDPQHAAQREVMFGHLFHWQQSLKRRIGLAYDVALGQGPTKDEQWGIIIGRW